MNRNTLLAVAVVAIVSVAAVLMLWGKPPIPPTPTGGETQPTGGNTPPTGGDTQPGQKQATLRGVSLSPRSFAGGDFIDFFKKAKQAGSVVTWSGDWAELVDSKGAPYVVAQLAADNGLKPVIIAQFFTQSTGKLLRPLNDSTRRSYEAGAVDFAKAVKPNYLGLGIEVNVLKEKSPEDYASFKAFFAEVATAVKQASPDTKVFTVFQLERLRGLRGGLYGGADDPAVNDWALLSDFPDADLLAFTTYPCLIYRDPSDIPADYYTAEITQHTSKPIAYTEAGWFRVGFAGWESTPEEQARFASRYLELTKPLNPGLLIWSFLYDQAVVEPFTSMGLLGKDGVSTPAWEAWLKP